MFIKGKTCNDKTEWETEFHFHAIRYFLFVKQYHTYEVSGMAPGSMNSELLHLQKQVAIITPTLQIGRLMHREFNNLPKIM